MGLFRFVASNKLRGAGVVGTVDATYQEAWLTDGNPGTPIQRTGNLSLAVTPTGSIEVDTFAIINHTVGVDASLTGGATATITAGALDAASIRLNPFERLSAPVTFSSAVTLAVTSNPSAVVIGEFVAGLSDVLDYDFQLDFDPGEPFEWEGEFSSIVPYDRGLSEPRRWSGDLVLTDAGFAKVQAWYVATRRGTLPSLIIPDDAVNDIAMVHFRYRERYAQMLHEVSLEFVEIPRTRW